MKPIVKIELAVSNFVSDQATLDFGFFKIFEIKPGPEALEWKERLSAAKLPDFVLLMEYEIDEDESITIPGSAFEKIGTLLIAFRLFKLGDIYFNDLSITEITENATHSLRAIPFGTVYSSQTKYRLNGDSVHKFVTFYERYESKIETEGRLIQSPLVRFMEGTNRPFYPVHYEYTRIVDYILAIEHIFSPGYTYMLSRTISKRVAAFIYEEVANCLKVVERDSFQATLVQILRDLYRVRNDYVHGNFLSLSVEEKNESMVKVGDMMPYFEVSIRCIILKIMDRSSHEWEKWKTYVKSIYSIPESVSEIMSEANARCKTILDAE